MLIANLKQAIRNLDPAMKKAQTRLDNRLLRPQQESCRDIPHYGYVYNTLSLKHHITPVHNVEQKCLECIKPHTTVYCFRLVDEVKAISESVSALKAQLHQADESRCSLLTARGNLEREIIVKRKTLYVDRNRCHEIRSRYPSTVALTGY